MYQIETPCEYREELLESENRLKVLRKKSLGWQITQLVVTLLLGISIAISSPYNMISLSIVNMIIIIALMISSYYRLNTIVYCNQKKMKVFRYINGILGLLLTAGIVAELLTGQENSYYTRDLSSICRDLNLSLISSIIIVEVYLSYMMNNLCLLFSKQRRSLSLKTAIYDKDTYEGVMKGSILVQRKNSKE